MNTRKIKSRFRRDHLLKLAKDLLSKDLELKSGTVKWFELRKGHSVEELVDSVSFKEARPKKDRIDDQGRYWHTVELVFSSTQKNWRGELIECERKEEFGEEDFWNAEFRGKAFRPGYSKEYKSLSFEEQIDHIIQWDLMRGLDHIVKDNSAIPIYI